MSSQKITDWKIAPDTTTVTTRLKDIAVKDDEAIKAVNYHVTKWLNAVVPDTFWEIWWTTAFIMTFLHLITK